MIYLASPYSHPIAAVREERYEQALLATGAMVKAGLVVYSPIVHFHPMSIRCSLPGNFQFWKRINLGMLERAKELRILELAGWLHSEGVTEEIRFARGLGLPVRQEVYSDWVRNRG